MKNIRIILISLLFFGITFSHSGRTDSSGGHNCRTGACAGTYHYHNGGSRAPAKKIYVAPKPVVCSTSECKLGNTCYTKPINAYCATNGRDAWVCNYGFVESGGKCILEVKEIECRYNQCKRDNTCYDKPTNANCTTFGGNIWICKSGYEELDGTCSKIIEKPLCTAYECESNGGCIDRPANASCLIGSSVAWDCNQGYVQSGESCVKIIQQQGMIQEPQSPVQEQPYVEQDIFQNQQDTPKSSGGTAALLTLLGYVGYKNRKRIEL